MSVAQETRDQNAVSEQEIRAAQESLRKVRARGVRWLLDHVADDGKPAAADIRNGYYRMPWVFAVVGEREVAARVLSWIERNTLTAQGDLREGVPREAFVHRWATYPHSLLAHGAWALERYDTALALVDTMRTTFQDPETGGSYMERPEARTGRQFIFPTAQMGLAALASGQSDVADGAFGWFDRLWAAQPELPDVLYASWGPQGLRTVADHDDEFISKIDFRKPRQAFYAPGISAAFLTRYYMVTRNERAKEIATGILKLSANGTQDQYNWWESMQICKFGWGSAMAAEIDPTGDHLKHVVRMARWYVESQGEDGSWVPSGFLVPEPNDSHAIEKTTEHTLWVSMMLATLAGAATRGPVAAGR
ncbi:MULTISPECIES: hypothetical protein [unclassified Amycolatopsis]|uniref:hypothetical protein n=1 Tax=unclassified Amycolatopsis TaxID=2618356 RepID=UPI001C6974D2|nr:hypothetical protein [Amycolatopsis sp. DSM 110486]QYN23515.1 hypothetical protein K1T34_14300 [Amycolatopsis sp. DSM 110486]